MSNIEIWTDGGCHGNPGPGGWAFIICKREQSAAEQILIEKNGSENYTTNNRMELIAVIKALTALGTINEAKPAMLSVYTDSQYVKKGITEWISGWKIKNWRTSSNKPVKNDDLWRTLDVLASAFKINWQWVKGHSGNFLNERCDELTQKAIESL